MTDVPYVELHAASAFSFLAAASQPEALIERAAELDMPALALADRNGLYGVARFHTAATRCGVKAHIGAEIAVSSFGPQIATGLMAATYADQRTSTHCSALRLASGLSESLPIDHALQDARNNQDRRRCHA